MLLMQLLVLILIFCCIYLIKSEELLNHVNSEATVTPASTKKDINSLALQTLPTTPYDVAHLATAKEKDFFSQTRQDLTTSFASLVETSSSSPSVVNNDIKTTETTSSWELIYPEAISSTSATVTSTSAFTTVPTKAALPKYFKVDDVKNCQKFFEQCLKQVLANVLPKLKDGNRSLNVPSLDPLYFNATAFQYNSGPFAGYITIRYALIYGLTTMKFKKVDFYKQADKFKARLALLVPNLTIIGSYKGDMHVNSVRVRPRGDFNVSATNLGVDLVSLGMVYTKDEHVFLKFTKGNATTTLKDSKVNATGIFPEQRLNDIVVNVANQYWRDLFNVVLPETRNNWLPILLDILNAAVSMVPLDFLNVES